MGNRKIIYYLALGFLLIGLFMGEVDARRKILRGRKTINRQYYRGLGIPAWTLVLLSGIGMLALGGGLYLVLKKFVVDGSEESGSSSYHPAMQDEV